MESNCKQSEKLESSSLGSGSLRSCSFHSDSLRSSSLHSNVSQTQDLRSTNVQDTNSILHSRIKLPNSFISTDSPVSSLHSISMKSSRLDSSSMGSSKLSELLLSQHDLALQAFCKQSLKSRLFRGFYIERRYVDILQDYRDIVALEKSEKKLYKDLLDIHSRVVQFYLQQTRSIHWFGLSLGTLKGAPIQPGSMEVYVWTELRGVAFGQYWFNIKSVRFREDEILLKLKMVRPIEDEGCESPLRKRISNLAGESHISNVHVNNKTDEIEEYAVPTKMEIGIKEFIDLIKSWGRGIKVGIYDFMANDLTKTNIINFLKFMGLLMISLASGIVIMARYLGAFTIHLLFEMSRLLHVLTPVILKLIDTLNKVIGGFYILLTMVWRDALVYLTSREKFQVKQGSEKYKSIEFKKFTSNSREPSRYHHQQQRDPAGVRSNNAQYGTFGRKFPM